MKTAYIVPGGNHRSSEPAYQAVGALFQQQGFTPRYVSIDWSSLSFNKQTRQLVAAIKPEPHKEVYLFGHSYGAVLALRASSSDKLNISGQILCSLSPAFAEDIPLIEENGVPLEKDKELHMYAETVRKNRFSSFIVGNKTPTFALAGEEEYDPLVKRVRELARALPRAQLSIIPGAKHRIDEPAYFAAIRDAILRLPAYSVANRPSTGHQPQIL